MVDSSFEGNLALNSKIDFQLSVGSDVKNQGKLAIADQFKASAVSGNIPDP